MKTGSGSRPAWFHALAGVVVLGFSGQALAAGDILSLRGDDGAFGIAEVGVSTETCADATDWIPVLVGNLDYGAEIPDGASRPDPDSYDPAPPPGGRGPNAERSCDAAGQPGGLLRAPTATPGVFTDLVFTQDDGSGDQIILSQTAGTYSGDAGTGTYKIRAPIGAPEPGTLALVATGLGIAGMAARRRRGRKG